ncbi:MAG: hypothetical protein KKA84_12955 [Bacteroidetes bacterium]|nr:hypothetical protein [Bacteroidota bacterium]
MGVIIKEVTNRSERKKFVNFQFELYKNNKYWVPPLKSDEVNDLSEDKNPAFEFCEAKLWLAYKDDKIVGRIAGIINRRYIEKWKNNYARFGWVDFIDDHEVSDALFETAEKWAKEKGTEFIHGPLGFTDFDPEGTLIEGFEEVSTLGAIYNYPYYPEHIEKLGYKKDTDWLEYQVFGIKDIPEKVSRIANIVEKRQGLTIVKAKKAKDLLPYAHDIFHVLNAGFKDLYGFVELSPAQIDKYVKQYFSFIKPEYVPVILDRDGKVAAFGITMPSLSRAFQKAKGSLFPFGFLHILRAMKNNKGLDLYLAAVRPDLQDKGLNALFMHETNKLILKYGIEFVETNRELEGNEKVQAQWRHYDHRQHKRRRCYIKKMS